MAALGVLCLVGGCQRNVSPDTYAVGSVGQVNRAVRATVISARPVQIGGTQSGIGPAAGAAAGGIVGSQIGRGSGNAAAVLAGVLIGGVTGAVVEEATTRQAGIEYVLQSDNGALLTLIQGTNPAFVLGQKVVIIYGTQSRIIAVPD